MSADFLDDASENESNERDRLIQKARQQKPKFFTGFCGYCNDTLNGQNRQFCSPECRDDFELEQAAVRRHNGRC